MGSTWAVEPTDRTLLSAFAAGSADLHTIASADGALLFVSAASARLFGWRPDELVGGRPADYAHPDDAALLESALLDVMAAPGTAVVAVYRFRCLNGSYRWTEAVSNATAANGRTIVLSTVRDISDRKNAERDLERQATTDPLTGVANRRVFIDRLHHALVRLERHPGLVAVLFLDLDRFKLINDSVGHHFGDAVLLQMAERLLGFLRPQDTVARLGGDEFAIVVEDLAAAGEAVDLAARIVASSADPFVVGEEQFNCTASVGISVTADPQHGHERLLQEADLALYRAKDRGRDRAEMFDEDLRTRAVGRLGTERMLRRAIDEDRLRLVFQPIIDLRTGNTVAAEALVRVWDPNRPELIEAATFIEVAEETGLLSTIDAWVLLETIRQVAHWRDRFAGCGFADVSINLTARHLADAEFAQSVIDALEVEGVRTDALQIEVTERVLMEASNSSMAALTALRAAGVRVGLDDFGTGYSSLSYLRMFPLDFVKIDQSFIAELALGASARAIVTSVIDLSHALGMSVVAEGVETDLQLDLLRSLGCDRAQGFLFASPGPPDQLEARVLGRPGGDERERSR
jgi:diguanylate cyclase (GGDEF)-like protein/PAS domain S-box-containing protein